MNDKTIDSILEETRQFPPSKESSNGANITKEHSDFLKRFNQNLKDMEKMPAYANDVESLREAFTGGMKQLEDL